jgi:hypothetical protein
MSRTRVNWHRAGRLVAVALALFCVPPAVVMTIQGEHVGANNALSVPIGWCAILWFLGVPFSEDDDG